MQRNCILTHIGFGGDLRGFSPPDDTMTDWYKKLIWGWTTGKDKCVILRYERFRKATGLCKATLS